MTPAACIELAQRLEELGKKATGGTWYLTGELSDEEAGVAGGVAPGMVAHILMPGDEIDEGYQDDLLDGLSEQNIELIVELRNNLPLILGSLRGLAVAVEALENLRGQAEQARVDGAPCNVYHESKSLNMAIEDATAALTAIAGLVGGGG